MSTATTTVPASTVTTTATIGSTTITTGTTIAVAAYPVAVASMSCDKVWTPVRVKLLTKCMYLPLRICASADGVTVLGKVPEFPGTVRFLGKSVGRNVILAVGLSLADGTLISRKQVSSKTQTDRDAGRIIGSGCKSNISYYPISTCYGC
jgi:hypothetical protein